jgi:Fe-S cluster biogenesis protein NfuA
MSQDMISVVIAKITEGKWQAHHIPSGGKIDGDTKEAAEKSMKDALGLKDDGSSTEPPTSGRFKDLAKSIALFLEGPVSDTLAFHSGHARLESFDNGVAQVRLGGGCKGCPSSQITLFNGVRSQLQGRFGEDIIEDVTLFID